MATSPLSLLPSATGAAFEITDRHERFRQTMRRCVELGKFYADDWCHAHFQEFKEVVTTREYDDWMKIKAFEDWFSDGAIRKRSALEIALTRRAAEGATAAALQDDNPAVRLRAASNILSAKDTAPAEGSTAKRRGAALAELRGGKASTG